MYTKTKTTTLNWPKINMITTKRETLNLRAARRTPEAPASANASTATGQQPTGGQYTGPPIGRRPAATNTTAPASAPTKQQTALW